MSSLAIAGDTSGQVTIAAPAVAGTTTLTLPATTGTVLADTTVGVCRAWVNFNGTGTPAIRGSFNVTNITDNGTGDYTVNFTTAMTDTNFSTVGTTGSPAAAHGILMFFKGTVGTYPATTSSIQIATVTSNGGSTQFDYVNVCLAVFR